MSLSRLVILFLVVNQLSLCLFSEAKNKTAYYQPQDLPEETVAKPKLKIAICLTGQLARLEMLSKIINIIIPNAKIGNTVHLFVLLDNEVEEVKQTFWRYDYSAAPFATYNARKMQAYISKRIESANIGQNFMSKVRLEPPSQNKFEVVADFVPVDDKVRNASREATFTEEKTLDHAFYSMQTVLNSEVG